MPKRCHRKCLARCLRTVICLLRVDRSECWKIHVCNRCDLNVQAYTARSVARCADRRGRLNKALNCLIEGSAALHISCRTHCVQERTLPTACHSQNQSARRPGCSLRSVNSRMQRRLHKTKTDSWHRRLHTPRQTQATGDIRFPPIATILTRREAACLINRVGLWRCQCAQAGTARWQKKHNSRRYTHRADNRIGR